MLEMGITFDLAQLVWDHEIAEMILHALKGVPVNDTTRNGTASHFKRERGTVMTAPTGIPRSLDIPLSS